jgi:MFS transporter, CP family, cyanate transporter
MHQLVVAVFLLWLAGNALRLTVLAVPPVVQMIKGDLGLTATEIGVLAGIPIVLFAAAALPGSMLIARFGAVRTLLAGLLISGIGSGLRGAAANALSLDAATVLVGFGVAVMQPAMPPLVRQWLPQRVGFGTAVYTNGLLVGEILPASLTIPLILPMTGGSWRASLAFWGVVVIGIAASIAAVAPRSQTDAGTDGQTRLRWWPDWRNELIWRLGLVFGSVNSIYFLPATPFCQSISTARDAAARSRRHSLRSIWGSFRHRSCCWRSPTVLPGGPGPTCWPELWRSPAWRGLCSRPGSGASLRPRWSASPVPGHLC